MNRRVFVMNKKKISVLLVAKGTYLELRIISLSVDCEHFHFTASNMNYPASILHKSIAGRYRPVSYADGPPTARYRFM